MSNMVEQGSRGVVQGTGDGGRETVTAWDLGMVADVEGARFGETARFWVFRGKRGAWDTFWGCFGTSRCVFRCSGAAVCRSEWWGAGGWVDDNEHVIDDVVGV